MEFDMRGKGYSLQEKNLSKEDESFFSTYIMVKWVDRCFVSLYDHLAINRSEKMKKGGKKGEMWDKYYFTHSVTPIDTYFNSPISLMINFYFF